MIITIIIIITVVTIVILMSIIDIIIIIIIIIIRKDTLKSVMIKEWKLPEGIIRGSTEARYAMAAARASSACTPWNWKNILYSRNVKTFGVRAFLRG